MLVYGNGLPPASLVVHGYEGKTWFSLVDTPQQPIDPGLYAIIRRTLSPGEIIHFKGDQHVLE